MPIVTTLENARRLAVTKQHLAGKHPRKGAAGDMLKVVQDLAYVQWDPVTVVAPSHIISLWSRIGSFRISDLDRLLWDERKLLLHWTPIASIVSIEDYPIYRSLMERYPDSLTRSWGRQRDSAKEFLARHVGLRKSLLKQLGGGPLQLGQFKEYVRTSRNEDGWSAGSEVTQMLFHLHMSGEVLVVGHQGNQNVWGLTEEFLPRSAERKALSESEFEYEAAQRALRALGTATSKEIWYYFVRGRYQNLEKTIEKLEEESKVQRVRVDGLPQKEDRYVHRSDVQLLERMNTGTWVPRISLLPPFDNLISGRERLNKLFGFDYVREQFLPKEKRKFGTYVLPIVWGDRIIGRVDPQMDKRGARLLVHSVHAEPGAPLNKDVGSEIGNAIGDLAEFLEAKEVVYSTKLPEGWRSALR
jgi:uncharacterized protein